MAPEFLPIGAAIAIPQWNLRLRRWVEWHGFVAVSSNLQVATMERRYPSGYFAGDQPRGPNMSPIPGRKETPMPDVRVTCINKQPRNNPHEGITHLGGVGWKWTRQQVINSINDRTNTFFTLVNGKRADVAVVSAPNGQYVRTYADGVWNDNLLALEECG
jgi:hypothetical protein